jgi:peptidoglycan/xylan/chitin deacetylase (PgdA/CDA1 family)
MEAGRTIVLLYHSHHVVGSGYADNDHVALAHDLPLIRSLGGRIVPLCDVVAGVGGGPAGTADAATRHAGAPLRVALTFDDGPVYDVAPFAHPAAGPQPGFLAILQAFARTLPDDERRALRATSFVIASPAARRHMETSFDALHTFLGAGSMSDDWWLPALDTGFFDIANHSWDHLHPALPEVAHSAQAKGDFTRVASTPDADRQIADAARWIARRTNGRALPYFAYPFGHYNAFLTDEYLPRASGHGVRAAFTVDGAPVRDGQGAFRIPRYACGQHWREPDALRRILCG